MYYNLADQKRAERRVRRIERTAPNAKLYISDENGNIYRYKHYLHFNSIAEEYHAMQELKAFLENQNAHTIQVTTKNGIEREYKHTYTIKHIKTA